MRYRMKQKILAWGDDFRIQDEAGEPVYEVDGKVFSWGDRLELKDLRGSVVAEIDQKLLAIGPTYEIRRGGKHVATVKKKLFTFFKDRFTVDVPGPDDLEVEGDLLDHEYEFRRGGRTVARVSKRFFSFADSYGIDVAEGEDDVLVLASAVVVDLVAHGGDDD